MQLIVALAAAVEAGYGYGYGRGYGYGGYRSYGYGKREAEAEPGYGYGRGYGYGGYGYRSYGYGKSEAVAPAAHAIHKRQVELLAALPLVAGAGLLATGFGGYGRRGYGRGYRYGKRSAQAALAPAVHAIHKRQVELAAVAAFGGAALLGAAATGFGGYGRGYRRGYRYGKRSAEADASLLYAGHHGYAGALGYGYAGLPYTYGAYPIHVPSLVAYPNGAVTPVDEPAVQAAKADHFAAKAAAYAAAPLAIAAAPIAVAPAAHIIHKRQAGLALAGATLLGYGLAGSYGGKYRGGYRYGKRSADPGYGYRSYGYGRRYGGYGYGYRSYGYGY